LNKEQKLGAAVIASCLVGGWLIVCIKITTTELGIEKLINRSAGLVRVIDPKQKKSFVIYYDDNNFISIYSSGNLINNNISDIIELKKILAGFDRQSIYCVAYLGSKNDNKKLLASDIYRNTKLENEISELIRNLKK